MMRSSAQTRLWVGPLMLVIVIALIYLLSLMPSAAQHMRSHQIMVPDEQPITEYAMKGQAHMEWEEIRSRQNAAINTFNKDDADESDGCLNGGIANQTDGVSCVCTRLWEGGKCEIPICKNEGAYNSTLGRCVCAGNWAGDHCLYKCTAGVLNKTTGSCDCGFGRPCGLIKCINGEYSDGKCVCFAGFTGPSCTACDGTMSNVHCDDIVRRRGNVNSRLTLSGLSFCIITIGLLCVGARRRRSQMAPMGDETWYRVFHPNNNRPFRCRHDYMCGGSWVPRDRALIVAPGRVSMSTTTPRIHRLATPPPSYTSVDDLNIEPQQMPPTYEEATRIEIEQQETNLEVIDENEYKDESTTIGGGEPAARL